MSTWKKVLTEDDGNIASTDLTIDGNLRSLSLGNSSGVGVFAVADNSSNGILTVSHDQTPDEATISFAGLSRFYADAGGNQGTLRLFEGNISSNYIDLKAPTLSGNYTLTLPTTDGNADQVLKTNGSGTLSWVDQASGGGTIDGSGGSDRIAIWSDSDTLTSDSEITYSSATHKITAGAFTAAVVSGVAATGVVSSQTLQSAEINVGIVATNTVGAFGTGSRLLVKGGSFQGTLNAGRVMRYSQGQGTNPITTADHQSEAAATTMLFCSTDAQNAQELLLEGSIKMGSNQGWSTAAQGTPLYLGSSSGAVQPAPPSTSGYYSRIVGYVLDASNSIIYFCPDRSWVKIS